MKPFLAISFCCCAALVLSGCYNQDREEPIIEPDPWRTELTISEDRVSDYTVHYSETYSYSDYIHLEWCSTRQYIGDFDLTTRTTVERSQDGLVATLLSDDGNEFQYTFSADAPRLATHCTWHTPAGQERLYQFEYTDGELTAVDEYIDSELYSSVRLVRIDKLNSLLKTTVDGQEHVAQLRYLSSDIWVSFPNYFLLDSYPLNKIKEGFYAGFMGNNFRLIAEISYSDSSERTLYTYNADLQTCVVPEFCQQTIGSYVRTVRYELNNK